jgi:hypothetical protein
MSDTSINASCSVNGCERPIDARGLCSPHYYRMRRHGDPTAGGTFRSKLGSVCSVSDCEKTPVASGLCKGHWFRRYRYGDPTAGTPSRGNTKAFLELAIKYIGNDCLLWTLRNDRGYGTIHIDGKRHRVSRLVCARVHGPSPYHAQDVAHSCGVPACVNPGHLRWATHTENMRDKIDHGTNGVKLNDSIVRAIRAQPHRSADDWAKELGTHASTIYKIRSGETWRNL